MSQAWQKSGLAFILGSMILLFASRAPAAVPEAYRKAWSDPAVVKRIDEGIERHRKGDAVVEVVDAEGRPVDGASLDIRQQTHKFLFGCNAFVLGQMETPFDRRTEGADISDVPKAARNSPKNEQYEQVFSRLFNFATVPFYWSGIEPRRGELRYQEGGREIWCRPPPDRFIAFAKKYGITLKGHPVFWWQYLPTWLPEDPAEIKRLYQKRFREIAERYARDIQIWDIVNESLSDRGKWPLFTPDRSYVPWAFNEAGPLFRPDNVLMINEGTEVNDPGLREDLNSLVYHRRIKQWLSQGVDIRGIGFQFHFFSGRAGRLAPHLAGKVFPPASLLDVYESFADLDRPLFVTEITVSSIGDDGEAVQAEVVGNLYRLWFSSPRMAGITWWNLADFTGAGTIRDNTLRTGLTDEYLRPKKSYLLLDKLINHDWKTRLSARTDARGQAAFRGFYGKYSVKATAGDAVEEFAVDLDQGSQAVHRLVFKSSRMKENKR